MISAARTEFRATYGTPAGLVTGGLVMILVPYGIGAFAAISARFRNESTWLVAPVFGPWLTL